MKLNYDNLDDARVKLLGTFCMYKGKAFVVKNVHNFLEPDGTYKEGKYGITGSMMQTGKGVECMLDDPEFNCSNYNLGYMNLLSRSAWFYRVPMKQWRQGLRHDQVRSKYSKREFSQIEFQPGRAVCSMLENSYPEFKSAADTLRTEEANIVAFHKNFAMTFDRIHKDYIIEYKGVNIGFSNDLKDLKLMDEHQHLMESLKEAVG